MRRLRLVSPTPMTPAENAWRRETCAMCQSPPAEGDRIACPAHRIVINQALAALIATRKER